MSEERPKGRARRGASEGSARGGGRASDDRSLDRAATRELFERLAAAGLAPARERSSPKGQRDAFRACVSCMLSAQSLDRNTAEATRRLFRLARTPRTILALDDERLVEAIRPAGLYNVKARNLRRFCRALIDEHGGTVPATREGLMSLPGIGRKCADIVLSFTFGADVVAVDTHVHRVCNRTGLARGTSEAQTARALEARLPDGAAASGVETHVRLLNFGKRVCTSRAPKCPRCPIADLCLWPDKRQG